MTSEIAKPLLLVFVDGLGIAPADSTNPLSTLELPNLARLVGGPIIEGTTGSPELLFKSIDACLGIEGLPQSATGQATLFTGRNAARLLGRHVPALPGEKLRDLIEQHSIFKVLAEHQLRCAFANAFTQRFFDYLKQPRRRQRPSASLSAALAGNVRLRTEGDLRQGEAVAWDITREFLGVALPRLRLRAREKVGDVSNEASYDLIEADLAGRHLYSLALRNHFTLFETFVTDLAGHGRYVIDARAALERVDGLVGGLVGASETAEGRSQLTVVLTSDHGNVEDLSTPLHTRNPVPLIVWGPGASSFRHVRSLVDVVPAMLEWLAVASPEVG